MFFVYNRSASIQINNRVYVYWVGYKLAVLPTLIVSFYFGISSWNVAFDLVVRLGCAF